MVKKYTDITFMDTDGQIITLTFYPENRNVLFQFTHWKPKYEKLQCIFSVLLEVYLVCHRFKVLWQVRVYKMIA